MKNGVKKHMNDPSNIGPILGQRVIIGPDIDVPGWGQRYSSPYQLPLTKPTDWNGPDRPDFTRGRHPFRTLPRGPGYPAASINPNMPAYAHGVGDDGLGLIIRGYSGCAACSMGQDAAKTTGEGLLFYALMAAMAYGLYRAVAEGAKK